MFNNLDLPSSLTGIPSRCVPRNDPNTTHQTYPVVRENNLLLHRPWLCQTLPLSLFTVSVEYVDHS